MFAEIQELVDWHATFPAACMHNGKAILLPSASADTMSGMADDFTPEYIAALRARHPDWSPQEVQQRVKEFFLHAVT